MPSTTFQISELLGEVRLGTFSLSQIHDFPEAEWHSQRMLYANLEQWFNGDKLNEKQVQGGRSVDKYPIKINPIRAAVHKHAYALFGEVADDSRPLCVPSLQPDDLGKLEVAKKGQDFLNRVWHDSYGRSQMMTSALGSQIYGGSVFKASWVPDQKWRKFPIRIENVHVSNFVGIPMSGDHYRLSESWIVKAISPVEAERSFGMYFPPEEMVYYVEYWTPDEYEITINGQIIPTGKVGGDGKEIKYAGPNPFGVVPITYIPHIRTTDFYGESLITQNLQGIVQEMNKRVADYGDAVSDDSHRYYVIKNVSGRPEVYELSPGLRVIQLPSSPAITGKEQSPDMDMLGSIQASAPMKDLNEQLYDHFRREAFIPKVADGEDEGSQRSALTLAMRMWPLLSHTSMERIFWQDALANINATVIQMGITKGLQIPKEIQEMRLETQWAPMLPRDREVFVNELISRAGAKLGSLEHLLSLLDDIEDPHAEYERVKAQIKEMAELIPKPEASNFGKSASPNSPTKGSQDKALGKSKPKSKPKQDKE